MNDPTDGDAIPVGENERKGDDTALPQDETWPRWAPRFLEKLGETRSVRHACIAIGKDPATAYRLRERNAAFAKAWEEIIEVRSEDLEASAFRLAIDGLKEPVIQNGRVVAFVTKRYPALLAYLLKVHGGPKYRNADPGEADQHESAQEIAKAVADLVRRMRETVPKEPPPGSPEANPTSSNPSSPGGPNG